MRLLILLLLLSSAHCLRAQEQQRGDGAWGEWAAGFQHSAAFLSPAGDSMNQVNAQGWFHGRHVYTRYAIPRFSDTTDYILGRFEHGQPVGDWTLHYRDGRYATGPYNARPEGKAKQGIFNKIGVWRFYDASGQLLKTLRYDHTPNRSRTWKLDAQGKFVLVGDDFTTKNGYGRERLKAYFEDGSRQLIKRRNWLGYRYREWYPGGQLKISSYYTEWFAKRHEYYPDGQIQRRFRGIALLGYRINTSTRKEYMPTGEIKRVSKGPYVETGWGI